ncbi:helix-turn-helix transcriptional regulator [Nonomuraea sp. NPDC049486]|uniref:helix-turn-helix domain-containing protein n=1 Tax=Nonomuraea sp. NPDC049486 TaxID=3155773 RepID=UPI00341E5CE3
MTAEGSPTPGRPLWEAAEHVRTEKDWTIDQLAERAGIGRATYNRLATNRVPPQARTVRKIASAIGMPLAEAIRLSGLTSQPAPAGDIDLLPVITFDQASPDIMAATARILRQQLQQLREAAAASGRTLGDLLVDLELVRPEELRLSGRAGREAAVDLPDGHDRRAAG